jgi:DNA-binding Xre family transcriptional regulator
MNDALDMTQITVAELRTWIDEAREMTLACLEGTSLRTIRQAHLDRLCAELKRRWD